MDFLNSSDVEVAAYILNEGKVPMYYKDLIMEILEKKQKNVQSVSESISEIYTQINMDSRFFYVKDGNWGLTEWYPEAKKPVRRSKKIDELED